MNLSFRRINDNDLPFLKQVYRSTREDELAMTDWSDQQKDTFIEQQFDAQHKYYQQVYANATFEIIEADQQPAGRLYLYETSKQIRIVDIALLMPFRNQGIGSTILNSLIEKTEKSKKVLSIHVECYNPALKLYQRLGFEQCDQTGVYFYMERKPLILF